MEFWAANPRMREYLRQHPAELAALESEGARLRAELAAIEALSDENACRLCGSHVALTDFRDGCCLDLGQRYKDYLGR